jgi:hypothetical protein
VDPLDRAMAMQQKDAANTAFRAGGRFVEGRPRFLHHDG